MIASVGWYCSPMSLQCLDATSGTNLWSCPVGSALQHQSTDVRLGFGLSADGLEASGHQRHVGTRRIGSRFHTAQCYKYFAVVAGEPCLPTQVTTEEFGRFQSSNRRAEVLRRLRATAATSGRQRITMARRTCGSTAILGTRSPVGRGQLGNHQRQCQRVLVLDESHGSHCATDRPISPGPHQFCYGLDSAPHTNAWSFYGGLWGHTPAVANGMV